jgi:hypothetical protein
LPNIKNKGIEMFGSIKEFFLYLKYRKIVKSESASDVFWTRKGLRYDWLCRIYTVVNLPPQVTMSKDLPMEVRPGFVFDYIKPINEYLRKVGLEEMVTVSIDPIETTNNESYLVVYYFMFKRLSWMWVFFYLSILVGSFWSFFYFLF